MTFDNLPAPLCEELQSYATQAEQKVTTRLVQYFELEAMSGDWLPEALPVPAGARPKAKQAVGILVLDVWTAIGQELEQCSDLQVVAHLRAGLEAGWLRFKERALTLRDLAATDALKWLLTNCFTQLKDAVGNLGSIIRELGTLLMQGYKVLLYNPEGLLVGDRLREVARYWGLAAATLGANLATSLAGANPACRALLSVMPANDLEHLIRDILEKALMLRLYADPKIQQIVRALNQLPCVERDLQHYRAQAEKLDRAWAQLQGIDFEGYARDCGRCAYAVKGLDTNASTDRFDQACRQLGIQRPWDNFKGFSRFMSDSNNTLCY